MSPSGSLGHLNKINLIIWLLMSLQAGAINVGGFLACHRFVTHTTGFATHFGAELALGHWQLAIGMLFVPVYFLMGAITSGHLIDRQIYFKKAPRYKTAFGLIAAVLLAVVILGELNYFGEFGAPLSFVADFLLISSLGFSSGLQNATITSASGAVIRTTHLTGLTTDLGIGIARALDPERNLEHRKHESKVNRIRMLIIGAFIIGSGLGALLFIQYKYLGFLAPAFVSIGILLLAHKSGKITAKEI